MANNSLILIICAVLIAEFKFWSGIGINRVWVGEPSCSVSSCVQRSARDVLNRFFETQRAAERAAGCQEVFSKTADEERHDMKIRIMIKANDVITLEQAGSVKNRQSIRNTK